MIVRSLLSLTPDETDTVEEPDMQTDGDDDPLGNLVRRAAAILGRGPGDGRPASQ